MTRRSRSVLCCVPLLFLSARARGGPLRLEGAPSSELARDPAALESIIREGYDRLTKLTEASGSELRFELLDFRTFSREEFEGVRFGDLVDLPGGSSINMTRDVRYQNGQQRSIQYLAKWEERASFAESVNGRRDRQMSVDEFLPWAATDEPALAEVTAATTWRVTVRYEGRERSYRACAWWIDKDSRSERISVIINDNVVVGVSQAFLDFDLLRELRRSNMER